MSFSEKVFSAFSSVDETKREQKDAFSGIPRSEAESWLPVDNTHIAEYGNFGFYQYAMRGFRKNATVFATADIIAGAMNEAEIKAFEVNRDGTLDETKMHPSLDLLREPNPKQNGNDLIRLWTYHQIFDGNSYWQKIRNGNGIPTQLWPMRPDLTDPMINNDNQLTSYRYNLASKYVAYEPDDDENGVKFVPSDRIIHTQNNDVMHEHRGMPRILPAMREVISDNEATDFVTSMIQNSAMPGVVLTTNEPHPDRDAVREIQENFSEKYGQENRGKPAVIGDAMGVQDISHTFREMEFPELRRITETRICQVNLVPPIVADTHIGHENTSYANFKEANLKFHQQGMNYWWQKLEDSLNKGLAPEYGSNIRFKVDPSSIEGLYETPKEERLIKQFKNSVITANELREQLGYGSWGKKGEVVSTPQGRLRDLEDGINDPAEREIEEGGPESDEDGSEDEEDSEGGNTQGGDEEEASEDVTALLKSIDQKLKEEKEERDEDSKKKVTKATFKNCMEQRVPELMEEGLSRAEAFLQAEDECRIDPEGASEGRHEHDADNGELDIKQESREAVEERDEIAEEYAAALIALLKSEFEQEIQEIESEKEKAIAQSETPEAAISQMRAAVPSLATAAFQRLKENSRDGTFKQIINASAGTVELEVDDFNRDLIDATSIRDKITRDFSRKISDTTEKVLTEELDRLRSEGATMDEVSDSISQRISWWDDSRARMVARTEASQTTNRAAVESYKAVGIERKQWLARADACPYCAELDGTIVDIDTAYINDGEEFEPEGASSPLHLGVGSIEHPPAHPNCRCMVVPA